MSISKTAMTVSSVAMAMIFGGGVFLFLNFGALAKNIAERIASDTLNVPVSISSVNVALQEKTVIVSGVKVGNPQEYDGAYAATMDKIYMKADTLSQTLLRFNDITVSGTEVYLEVHPDGTNLTDIKNTVDTKAAAGDKAAQQIKVIIESMRIEKMNVNPKVLLPGVANIEPIAVPDIILRGIGVKENGVLASEAIAQIWADIARRVSKAANEAGYYEGMSPEALKEVGIGQIQQIKEQLSNDMKHLSRDLQRSFSVND
jgi:hypothetical protein